MLKRLELQWVTDMLAWTSDVTLQGSWITQETCLQTGVYFHLWPTVHSFHIEVRSQILWRRDRSVPFGRMKTWCHCARLSNIIVSNGITGSKKQVPVFILADKDRGPVCRYVLYIRSLCYYYYVPGIVWQMLGQYKPESLFSQTRRVLQNKQKEEGIWHNYWWISETHKQHLDIREVLLETIHDRWQISNTKQPT